MSDEEKKDSKKEEEEKASDQAGQTDETKDTGSEEDTSKNEDQEEEDKGVTLTKEEHDKLLKKSNDFDGIIEKQRLKKLAGKTEDKAPETKEEVSQDLLAQARQAGMEAAQDEIRKENLVTYETNLGSAYQDLIKDHKWLDDDDKISSIGKNFNPGSSLSKEDLLLKLKRSVQETYPSEYDKFEKDRIRSEVLAESQNIKVGGAGSSAPASGQDSPEEQNYNKEDKRIADKFFGGDVSRYLKTKDN